jgi:hypothetical protein
MTNRGHDPFTWRQAIAIVDAFADRYLVEQKFFTPADVLDAWDPEGEDEEAFQEAQADVRLKYYRTQEKDGALIMFFILGHNFGEKDPEIVAGVNQTVNALRAAHPELASVELHTRFVDP